MPAPMRIKRRQKKTSQYAGGFLCYFSRLLNRFSGAGCATKPCGGGAQNKGDKRGPGGFRYIISNGISHLRGLLIVGSIHSRAGLILAGLILAGLSLTGLLANILIQRARFPFVSI